MSFSAHEGHAVGEIVQLPGGITSIDHTFELPLNHVNAKSDLRRVRVFARELFMTRGAEGRPYLLFLQGGPGFPAQRTMGTGGWVGRALKDFRVILLDQRGTGKSSPITAAALAKLPSPQEQAEFLTHFRADSIVEDAEAIRSVLVPPPPPAAAGPSSSRNVNTNSALTSSDTTATTAGAAAAAAAGRWTVLGQSFGGFCLLTYLSRYPAAIEAGLFTGGLAPLDKTAAAVYRATYNRCAERNRRFYARYPNDVAKVRAIVQHLSDLPEGGAPLPGGGLLTPRRFLQLGLGLGGGSGMETLHYLIDEAFTQECTVGANSSSDSKPELSYTFLRAVESSQSFETNPVYALLHEAIYCQQGTGASQWAAENVLAEEPSVLELFDYRRALQSSSDSSSSKPVYFTGEMVYSWMFDGDYAQLAGLKEAADILAAKADWGSLYCKETLSKSLLPCAAAVYYDDMYVERDFSEETANLMPDCKMWITNRYQHSGLRDDGVNIFETLLAMTRNEISIPS